MNLIATHRGRGHATRACDKRRRTRVSLSVARAPPPGRAAGAGAARAERVYSGARGRGPRAAAEGRASVHGARWTCGLRRPAGAIDNHEHAMSRGLRGGGGRGISYETFDRPRAPARVSGPETRDPRPHPCGALVESFGKLSLRERDAGLLHTFT